MSKTVVKTTPFLLIAAPDATMTLRTLQSYLEPLLNLHPHGQVLLLGLPGLPNTHWPRSLRLTAPVQARAAARLLHYLLRSGKLNPTREVPVFWVGFGNGSMSLISLLTGALVEDPELAPLKNATRLVTFLNGFSWVDPVGQVKMFRFYFEC